MIAAAGLAALAATAVAVQGKGTGPLRAVALRERAVALTFDDGPDPRYTPVVLRLLAREEAHATFFLIGRRALAQRALLRAELAAGDEIGDHTLDHAILTRLSPGAAAREITAGASAIVAAGAPRPTLFRPPLGKLDATVTREVSAARLRIVLWSVAVERETDHNPTARAVSDLLRKIRPGAIVLAHDGGPPDRRGTLAALPALLRELRARGYRIVTVGELCTSRARIAGAAEPIAGLVARTPESTVLFPPYAVAAPAQRPSVVRRARPAASSRVRCAKASASANRRSCAPWRSPQTPSDTS